jgi:glutamine amidotransferase
MIALLDYRAGNLTSVRKALAALGADVLVPADPRQLAGADGIIVPGVGHFNATRALDRPWIDAILDRVSEGRPLLGICLGMQWLFESSDEAPALKGLGLLPGRCVRLGGSPGGGAGVDVADGVKVPHVGWNSLRLRRDGWISEGVRDGAHVYFTHSYVAPITSDSIAVTGHGADFASVVERGRVAGVQFHPEKSGEVGLRFLRNFLELAA